MSDAHDEMIARFLAAEGRERKRLLPGILALGDRNTAERIAPVIRDPSPRVAARVTALLARHGLDELFEGLLEGLKTGKVAVLRAHYRKIRKDGAE